MTTVLSGAHVSPSGEPGAISGGLPVGSIVEYGGSIEPAGWYFCYGQAITRTGINANLFSIIGTSFGAGDGTSTFNLPDYRGRVGVGLGNMGGTYADRIAYPRTANTTNASTSLTSADGNWIANTLPQPAAGMFIYGPGIPAGTMVVSIGTGTNIVMSNAATATQGGITVRFSVFDKLGLGGSGGSMAHQLIDAQMPVHSHQYYGNMGAISGLASGPNQNVYLLSSGGAGGDQAHPNTQPSQLVNVIIKYATSLSGSLIAGTGDVVGPAGAVDGSIALFDGTSGKQIKSTPAATFTPVGGIVQTVVATYALSTLLNTVLPVNATLPLITEGTQIISQLFTPRYANSKILVDFKGTGYRMQTGGCAVSGFRDGLAIAADHQHSDAANIPRLYGFRVLDSPGTIASVTYTVRAGPGNAGGMRFNGVTDTPNWAGALAATLMLQEIKQ